MSRGDNIDSSIEVGITVKEIVLHPLALLNSHIVTEGVVCVMHKVGSLTSACMEEHRKSPVPLKNRVPFPNKNENEHNFSLFLAAHTPTSPHATLK